MCRRWPLVLIALGCSEGESPYLDVVGKSGDEAARLVATRLCERDARCGKASVECSGGGSSTGTTMPTRCMGQIDRVDAAACFDDVFGDLSDLLSCKPISVPEATLLRACFEPLIARACLTQAEVDQAARMQEAGQSSNLNPRPAACQQVLSDLAGRCP